MARSRLHRQQSSHAPRAFFNRNGTQTQALKFITHVSASEAESLAIIVNHQGHPCIILPQFYHDMCGMCMFFHIM